MDKYVFSTIGQGNKSEPLLGIVPYHRSVAFDLKSVRRLVSAGNLPPAAERRMKSLCAQ